MCGKSPFLQRSCWAKFDSKTPVCTPFNIEVCKFENLIRGQDKVFSTKVSALANSFSFISFSSESICYVGFCLVWYFGSSCFASAVVLNLWLLLLLLLYTEAGTRTNCSLSKQMVIDGRSKECLLLWVVTLFRMPNCLFFASNRFFLEGAIEVLIVVLKFCPVMSFCALQFSFEKIYYTFAEEPNNLFSARLKEKTFAVEGKWFEHLQSRENLCVHRPKILTVSVGPGYENLREWIGVCIIT